MKKDHDIVKYAFDKSLKKAKKRIMSKPISKYPPAPTGVYSLRRLFLAIQLDLELPETVRVGGRYRTGQLVDQGGFIELPAEFITSHQPGENDLWLVDVRKQDLVVNEDRTSAAAKKILEAQLVVTSQKEASDPGGNNERWITWNTFLNNVRTKLSERGLIEVSTPSLVANPGMEPELEPFAVNVSLGRQKKTLYLPTSPELHLKQLLAKGLTDIFEVKCVFRNEELTEIHEPEFYMLEWYRAYANLDAIVEDLTYLIGALSGRRQPVPQMKVAEVFLQATGFLLTPKTTREELLQLAHKIGLKPDENEDWNNLFNFIWVDKVEPTVPSGAVMLRDYPPSLAALARINERGWADRLELYWNGVELANAFHELNDPVEQRERFKKDQKKRLDYGRTGLEIDENFMNALEFGIPPSGGIALGLDRLFMVINGFTRLKDGRPFSIDHQFKATELKTEINDDLKDRRIGRA